MENFVAKCAGQGYLLHAVFKPIDLWDPDLTVLAIGDSGLQNAALTQSDIQALDPNSKEKPKPLKTQGGWIVAIAIVRDRIAKPCNFMQGKSHTLKRVVRSSVAGETLIANEAAEVLEDGRILTP